MSNIDRAMPCKLDREVNDPKFDSFGHIDFAEALKHLIEGCNKPPYSIGLLGTWGTGKSSIKSLYCNDLKSDTVKDKNGKLRKEKIKEITFNAWKYGGNTNIKRALLRHVFIELGGSEETLIDQIYHTITENFSSELSRKEFFKKLGEHFFNTLLVALFSAIVIILFFLAMNFFIPSNIVSVTFLTLFFVVFVIFFTRHYLKNSTAFEKFVEKTRIKHPQTELEQWESLLIGQIKKFHELNIKCEKIVIFIDDLDRLSPIEMVEGLDGIRTFMEISPETNGSTLGIVFVISCDESRVAEAIRSRNDNSDLPGAIRSEDDARRYLDRIFQFRLEIPPFPKYDMREFALSEIERIYPEMIVEVETLGVSKKSFINHLIPPFVNNPRNVIQLVNAFSQSWWIAKIRELKGTGTERAGGLLEGTITKYPKTLAIICVFKVNFPHFYDKLIRQPSLIKDYSRVFIDYDEKFEDLDEYTKFLLYDYSENSTIKTDSRIFAGKTLLRQYIQSIKGHKWPESSLHPFLALNQDAISRKYPKISISVFNSLIQGIPEGVIQNLGVPSNERKISLELAELLNKLMDDIEEQEPEENIQNATFVLASIIHKIPEKMQSISIEHINSALISSQEFRSRVGLNEIKEFIDIAHPDDQRKIIAELLDDAFGDETFEIKFRSLQSPTIDEVEPLVWVLLELSLSVWKKHDLFSKSKVILTNWLLSRKINLKSGSTSLDIAFLEDFIPQYENQILPIMGLKYTDSIINEFENGNEILSIDALNRCKKILREYSQHSAVDLNEVWIQLSRLISVKNEIAVLVARELAEEFKSFIRDSQILPFITRLSDRLIQDTKNEDLEEWEQCANTLISFLKIPGRINDQNLLDKLVVLSEFYITGEGSVNFGIGLLEIILPLSKEKSQKIIHTAIIELHNNLPELAVIWLAVNYSIIDEKEYPTLNQELNKFLGEVPTSEQKIVNYKLFMEHLPKTLLSEAQIQNNIDIAMTQIRVHSAQFDTYGRYILPVICPLFQNSISPTAIQNLQIFINAISNNQNILPEVHGYFIGHWSPNIKIVYQPFFDTSIQLATKNPNSDKIGYILLSCKELIDKGIITTDKNADVLKSAALTLWPHFPKESMQVIISSEKAPVPESVANLIDKINLEDNSTHSMLGQIWSHISGIQDQADRVQCAKLILLKGKIKTSNEDDGALLLWFQSINDKNILSQDISVLIREGSLTDEHFLRLWNVAISLKEKLDKDTFLEFLATGLTKAAYDKSSESIIENKAIIIEMFQNAEERDLIARKLVNSYVTCENIDRKRKVVKLIRDLRGSSNIEKLMDNIELLNPDDIEILQNAFPNEKKTIEKISDAIKNSRKDSIKPTEI